jgi:hypothetical protein
LPPVSTETTAIRAIAVRTPKPISVRFRDDCRVNLRLAVSCESASTVTEIRTYRKLGLLDGTDRNGSHRLAVMPLSFTATQKVLVEHEIPTPATTPPGNTMKGVDHRPDDQVVTAPPSPMTEHSVSDAQETA